MTQVSPANPETAADLSGFELTKTERAEFDAILAEVDRLRHIVGQCAPGQAVKRSKQAVALATADPSEKNIALLTEAGRSDNAETDKIKRSAAKEAIRRLGVRTVATLIPALERFADGLTQAIKEREEGEREQCEELAVAFEPSPVLRSLARRLEVTRESITIAQKAPELVPANLRDTLRGFLPPA